jgi:hypothetical protein
MMAEHGSAWTPQVFAVPPMQAPPSQVSPMVQNLPSSHGSPFVGITTHVFSGPRYCAASLHTAVVHSGVSIFEQSIPQGPNSSPPVLLLLLVVLGSLSRTWPCAQVQPACHITGSKSPN